ncbi:hypothetical protein N788_10475 [Arenimonas donghaensis DSM 18148 = HO3-R19]|uniref:Uncharacterized protein n=1 Tax=Arenimonas donghaensis DSM 18148 = HO3-R19 TaxID=1121014 RepID=A0A087MK53_9GAMM|nr:hypothetical protein N788_10475 [Arenimonas donghaensis DSM 18148 = HO3-R19]
MRSCLALVLAVAVVPALNLAGSWLAAALQLPPGGTGRLAWDLGWLAASGIAMVATATALATRHHAAHAGLAGLLLGLGLGWAVASVGGDFPVWFTALALLTLPLQVGLGWWLGAPRHR